MISEVTMTAALDSVRAAMRVCERVRQTMVTADTVSKKDRSPVTVADFAAQAVVSARLLEATPDIPLIGEEDAAMLRDDANALLCERVLEFARSEEPGMQADVLLAAIDRGCADGGGKGTFWTLDPIDGTSGYIRGDQYAVALGLIVDGVVEFGVLGCPALGPTVGDAQGAGSVYYASRGGGAFMSMEQGEAAVGSRVSAIADPAGARFCESVESGHTRHDAAAAIVESLGSQGIPVRLDSQCKYAVVARGEADVYLRLPTRPGYEERIWDHAAGVVIVEESGGRVTDVTGKSLDFSRGRTLAANRGVVATNGHLHDAVLAAVAGAL